MGRSSHTLPGIFLSLTEGTFGPGKPGHEETMQRIEDLKNELEVMLGEY